MCSDSRAMKIAGNVLGCCDCCGPVSFVRRFASSREEQERLEEYKTELEKEIAGVEERIREIKGK